MDSVDNWLQTYCGEPFWNDSVIWNTPDPNLTRCFRQTGLTILPCLYLWLAAPFEALYVAKASPRLIRWSFTIKSRLVLAGLCVLLGLVETVLALVDDDPYSPSSEYHAPLIKAATFLLLCILMNYHRMRGIVTSGVVWTFVLINFLASLPVFYSVTVHGMSIGTSEKMVHGIYTLLLALLLVSCSFADHPVTRRRAPDKVDLGSSEELREYKPNPLYTASFPSKVTYWWFNGLAYTGWKDSLKMKDLWDISDEEKTASVGQRFAKVWLRRNQEIKTSNAKNSALDLKLSKKATKTDSTPKKTVEQPGVLSTIMRSFGWAFATAASLKFCYDCLQFANPQLLKWLIAFIESRTDPLWHGVLIALFIFGIQMVQSLILSAYFQRCSILGLKIRTCLTATIYRKALVLSNSSRKGTTVGEVVNLMSVDSQRIFDLMSYVNLLWSAPLQMGLSLYFLFNELGWSTVAGLIVMVILIPLNGYVADLTKKMQTKQMKEKDERVKAMNEILTGIKVIKLYAWEESFMTLVLGMRKKEVRQLRNIAYLNSVISFIWTCAPSLVALSTFAVYLLSDEKNILDAQKAFVSLALFNLLRFPLTMLPVMINFSVMAWVSVKRLNKFFNSTELDEYVMDDEVSEAITVEDASFTWEASPENSPDNLNVTLKDINLHVPKGSFLAVVGNVGTGKSSLLSALLGEMDKLQGKVNISGELDIAYVPQQAWIQNATLRDNILFGKEYDKRKYSNVIRACALKPDIEILPGGDETEIGEKGINLSGGQKQRVNLSRACYSDADLYLMDDPLSAVDSHVAKHLFDKVLSSKTGLLKTKTRILATNNISLLPNVDNIVVLKDGGISETGSYQELMDKDGDFAEFVRNFSTQAASTSEDSTESSIDRKTSVRSDRTGSIEQPANEVHKLIETEKAETGQVRMSVYVQYLRAVTWPWVILIFMSTFFSQVAISSSDFWLSRWSTDEPLVVNGTMVQDKAQSNMRLIVYGLIGLCQACFVFFSAFVLAKGTLDASVNLHRDILARILRSPMSFFDTTPLGRIVNRFSKDVDTVDSIIPETLSGWLECLLQVVASFFIISYATPLFLTVIVPISVVYYYIQKFYIPTSRQLKRLESITRSPIYSHFSETLSGVSTIRAYKANQRFINISDNKVDSNQMCVHPNLMSNRWLSVRLDFCGNCLVLSAALFAVFSRGVIDAGVAGLSVTYALNVTQYLNWAVRMTSEMETNIVSVERILEYSANPTEAEFIVDENRPKENWPDRGVVQFEDYGSRYRPGLDLVIKNITTVVHSEEKIGIVGRTGAGKSTITLALFRLIEPAEGKIVIDGVDVSKIGLHDLRSKITIIPQDPVLFSGTLRSNLDPFNLKSDEQLWKSLEHAHLKHFVKGLEHGLAHKVAEGGENLSVGQRQLICLARALLRKTKILVLDEATAAVDLETDSLIQSTIRKEFSDCTIFTIAHRLNTILDSTRVMVLDKGEIVEFDNPQVLLQNPASVFYSLAKDAGIV
ncbi:Multidrug resistance-associated protein 1 [Halotydeus destructor]|nr:Multidrug resistance-associated protein 1 [Halotydeus destructor]